MIGTLLLAAVYHCVLRNNQLLLANIEQDLSLRTVSVLIKQTLTTGGHSNCFSSATIFVDTKMRPLKIRCCVIEYLAGAKVVRFIQPLQGLWILAAVIPS